MVDPRGLTEPLSVAETLATFVAGLVVTTGALRVVKVLSGPKLVPPPLVATIRK